MDLEYDEVFYNNFEETTKKAAEIILPYVIQRLSPKSIVDFGCGEGMWLKIAKQINCNIEVCGLDGNYVNRERLKISSGEFQAVNLGKKIELKKKFDLAISLEVGEHIDKEYADVFVDNISRHADRILFSAAIPLQGGTHHVNERWQSYWIEKFSTKGFKVDFSVRNYFWKEKKITPWRRQNILFFYREENNPMQENVMHEIADVVHPEMYILKSKPQFIYEDVKKIYCKIDETIKKLIYNGKNDFVIYPFGKHGYLCKEILNHKYHINEVAIIDNYLSMKGIDNIYPCSYLKKIDHEFCVLLNCGNQDLQKELLESIIPFIEKEKIINIFGEEVK